MFSIKCEKNLTFEEEVTKLGSYLMILPPRNMFNGLVHDSKINRCAYK